MQFPKASKSPISAFPRSVPVLKMMRPDLYSTSVMTVPRTVPVSQITRACVPDSFCGVILSVVLPLPITVALNEYEDPSFGAM